MRKTRKRRRKSAKLAKAGAVALAAACALATNTQSYADQVRFENPGNQWDWGLGPKRPSTGDPYLDRQFLDITLGPAEQLGAVTPYRSPGWAGGSALYSTFRQQIYYPPSRGYTTGMYSYGDIMRIAGTYFAEGVPAGTQIGGMGCAPLERGAAARAGADHLPASREGAGRAFSIDGGVVGGARA